MADQGSATFRDGFTAMIPLWFGVIPFAVAYAISARGAGLTVVETSAMSLFVFAGAAQFSAVGMIATGAGGAAIIATTFLINLRHMLYSLNLSRRLQMRGPTRLLAAHLLTDEAFGVFSARDRATTPFLLGAGSSLFIVWNLSTLAGALLGAVIPDPVSLGLDFIFPVAFIALLVPLLQGRIEWIVALASGAVALVLSNFAGGGVTILVTGVCGSLLGAWLGRNGDDMAAGGDRDGTGEPRP